MPESDLFKLCSRCNEDYLHCICENFHPNIIDLNTISHSAMESGPLTHFTFNIQEIQALYNELAYQYISPEHEEVHAVLNKIVDIIKCHHGSTK